MPQRWFVRVAGLIVTRLGIARTSKLAGLGGLAVVLLMAALAGGAGIRAEERTA